MPNGAILEGRSKAQREKHTAWREAVRATAAADWPMTPPLAEPVVVALHFFMPLPASDPHRFWHVSAPDLDKLIRSTFDGLVSGGVLADDKWVCRLIADKGYSVQEPPGCEIVITSVAEQEDRHREASKQTARDARRAARRAS